MAKRNWAFELDNTNHLIGYPQARVDFIRETQVELHLDGSLVAFATHLEGDKLYGTFGSRTSAIDRRILQEFYKQAGFEVKQPLLGLQYIGGYTEDYSETKSGVLLKDIPLNDQF